MGDPITHPPAPATGGVTGSEPACDLASCFPCSPRWRYPPRCCLPRPVAAQARPCHPFTTEPRFRATVPTASEAIGVELGSRDVTTAESDAYLQAVDDASTRVITGTAGHSQQGRPLRYAIVGRSRNVTRSRLASIRDDVRALRAPTTSPARAARIARRSPAILWVASNVHGGEESGTDASLQVLYELADRSDCAARRILDTPSSSCCRSRTPTAARRTPGATPMAST